MRYFNFGIASLLLAPALIAAAPAVVDPLPEIGLPPRKRPKINYRPANGRRSRGQSARPKKRPNRLHLSRRTKARHRRARKAA